VREWAAEAGYLEATATDTAPLLERSSRKRLAQTKERRLSTRPKNSARTCCRTDIGKAGRCFLECKFAAEAAEREEEDSEAAAMAVAETAMAGTHTQIGRYRLAETESTAAKAAKVAKTAG
jgi:hypothetical protein